MKKLLVLTVFFLTSLFSWAQTPIDELMQQNLEYLEAMESEGYAFRSQIITEFDQANASQNVRIRLSEEYEYLVVALGDSNIPDIGLQFRPAGKANAGPMDLKRELTGRAFSLSPSKSGRFKITINAMDLGASQKGFVSFMVLRR